MPEDVTVQALNEHYHHGKRTADGKITCLLCPPGAKPLHPSGFWPHVQRKHFMTRTREMKKEQLSLEGFASKSHPPQIQGVTENISPITGLPKRKYTHKILRKNKTTALAKAPKPSVPARHTHQSVNQFNVHAPNATIHMNGVQQGAPLPADFNCCFRCGFNLRTAVFDTTQINNCPRCGQSIRPVAEAVQFLNDLPE